MDFKFFISIFATLLTFVGYFPYFRDIFAGKTKPHLYTWLIWGITQGTATVALLYGGGKYGSFSLISGTILVMIVFLLSFKYGTKDITRSDKIVLLLALLAIGIWWQLKNPIIALSVISAIDGVGYFPTIRKTFKDPWSETIPFWGIMVLTDLAAFISNAQYNFMTIAYLAVLFLANMTVLSVCIFRRRSIEKNYS